ncbi:formylmethanofuran dehydrogenase [Candidatus Bipolaricaulota bacterium]|nr:formylmethanofuran dehydrogenase [Candidatus Bipolaricaulota bacterium]
MIYDNEKDILLEKAKKFHGGMCPGIVIGTRMTIAGLRELGMNPFKKNHELIVYAEIDRCLTDAIQAITGVTLGHRTLKYMDYGKFAATFLNMHTSEALRVSVSSFEQKQEKNNSEIINELLKIPENELLKIQKVKVKMSKLDMPGKPKSRVICSRCGEHILDGKEVIINKETLCKGCANNPYYIVIEGE